jgi:catalase-peroxidase
MLKKIVVALGISGALLSTSAVAEDIASPQNLNLTPLRNLNSIDSPMGEDYSILPQ